MSKLKKILELTIGNLIIDSNLPNLVNWTGIDILTLLIFFTNFIIN